jgi:hypothetical protein
MKVIPETSRAHYTLYLRFYWSWGGWGVIDLIWNQIIQKANKNKKTDVLQNNKQQH